MAPRCRIFNVGPDSRARRSLEKLQREGLVSLQHADTSSGAFHILGELSDSERPDLFIIPVHLPVLTCFDFMRVIASDVRYQAIPMLVWGAQIPAKTIDQIYAAGAACVVPRQFGAVHLDLLRSFCRIRFGSTEQIPPTQLLPRLASMLLARADRARRNAKLGALFLWTGCLSATLWAVSFLPLGTSFTRTDFTPLAVYAALACAGMSLMWRPVLKSPAEARFL